MDSFFSVVGRLSAWLAVVGLLGWLAGQVTGYHGLSHTAGSAFFVCLAIGNLCFATTPLLESAPYVVRLGDRRPPPTSTDRLLKAMIWAVIAALAAGGR